jgi:hypothetical protein
MVALCMAKTQTSSASIDGSQARRSDNRAAVEVDTSGAEIGPVLRRSVYRYLAQSL